MPQRLNVFVFRFAVFAVATLLSIAIARSSANVALIWLPNAAAIFMCVDDDPRDDWIYGLGFFSLNALINLAFGDSYDFAVLISLANQIEIWTVTRLLRRVAPAHHTTAFETRLFRTFGALLIGPVVSAPLGVFVQAYYFNVPATAAFVHWFIADFASMVIVGGYFVHRRSFERDVLPRSRFSWYEVPIVIVLMGGLLGFQSYLNDHVYLVAIVPMIWVALRLPNALGSALISATAIGTLLVLPLVFNFDDSLTPVQQLEVLQAQIILGIFALTANIVHQLHCFNISAIETLAAANRDLTESRALADLAEEASQLGHWRINRDGDIGMSTMVHRIFGTDPETFRPARHLASDLYLEEDREKVRTAVRQAFDDGKPFEYIARIRRTDSAIRTVQVLGHPLIENGVATALYGVIQDLTDRKREEELRKAYAELERFSYACSHDLSEPTRLIAVLTDILIEEDGDNPDPQHAELLSSINRNARRLNELVGNLLTFSRIGQENPSSRVDLDQVADAVTDALSLLIKEKGARVLFKDLGTARGSEAHFRQIIQNIASNQLRHGRFGAPPELLIRRFDDPGLHLVFSDNADPAAPDAIDRIRSAVCLDNPASPPARGLGLWITANIVNRYGGRIEVRLGERTSPEIHVILPEGTFLS